VKSRERWEKQPVVGIEVFANDVVVNRRSFSKGNGQKSKRGEIMEFSEKARKRLAFIASNTEIEFQSMITLTYPDDYPTDGKTAKRHLYRFLAWVREQFTGVNYLWWMEFQKRGAPHFHILIDKQPDHNGKRWPGFQLDVALVWNDIVKGGHDHILAGTRSERLRSPEGARHYCVWYAQKRGQKAVPPLYRNVGRFFGYSKPVKPEAKFTLRCDWEQLKALLGDWDYIPDNEQDLYKVLFNTAGTVAINAVQCAMVLDYSTA